jgi:hypothetical protein
VLRPANPSDTVAFARAEDAFDLYGRLADISTPLLVSATRSTRPTSWP